LAEGVSSCANERPSAEGPCRWGHEAASVAEVKEGATANDLFGFLTTEPNAEVRAIHPKARPVLTTHADLELGSPRRPMTHSPCSGQWDRLHRSFPKVMPSRPTPLHQPLFPVAPSLSAAVACALLRFVAQGRSSSEEQGPQHWRSCLAGRPRLRHGFGCGVPPRSRSYR
jgi:hypothetical protein